MAEKPSAQSKKIDPEIARRLRQAIDSKNLKVKQFAREADMAYPSLRDYHGGLRKPGFDALAKIVRTTGVSANWLLLGEGNMFPPRVPPANVDEGLMGTIAQAVAMEYERAFREEALARKEDGADPIYNLAESRLPSDLNSIGERTVITASIYNRVAHLTDFRERDRLIKREAGRLVRLNRKFHEVSDHS